MRSPVVASHLSSIASDLSCCGMRILVWCRASVLAFWLKIVLSNRASRGASSASWLELALSHGASSHSSKTRWHAVALGARPCVRHRLRPICYGTRVGAIAQLGLPSLTTCLRPALQGKGPVTGHMVGSFMRRVLVPTTSANACCFPSPANKRLPGLQQCLRTRPPRSHPK